MRVIAYISGMTAIVLFSQASEFAPDSIPWSDHIMQGGALTILGWACWYLLCKHLPRERKDFSDSLDKICERHERWETTRHQDSQSLREAIDAMRTNCATVHERLMKGQ
jgi:hypothetical protein